MKILLGMKSMKPLSIEQIIALEPRVGQILQAARKDKQRRANPDAAYSWYKFHVSHLVGWGSPNESLRHSLHYETAIKALCKALNN